MTTHAHIEITRPDAHPAKNVRRAGAPNTQESGETLMVRPSLDDTLHAIVQVTHEHGLPLAGASARPGMVQVFLDDAADLLWWVRWLTVPTETSAEWWRTVVWDLGDGVAFHVSGVREGIEWAVVERVPSEVAVPVLAAHGVTVTTEHLPVSAFDAIRLAKAHARHASAQDRAEVA